LIRLEASEGTDFMSPPLILAVHISNGVLSPVWVWLGFVGMALLMIPAMIRVADEEIPQIALLTAAFFIASSLHVKLGPTSVHMLFNGLVGVVLGWRAALAIPVGLALQAFLLEHGGLSTIGINACVLTLPALLCSEIVTVCRRPVRGWRADMLWLSAALLPIVPFNQLLLTCLMMLVDHWSLHRPVYFEMAWRLILLIPAVGMGMLVHPLVLRGFLSLRRLSDFFLGCLIGAVGVAATLFLHALVLLFGGSADWKAVVWVVVASHLPVLVLEGVIMGFTLQFLGRVKPVYLVGPRQIPQIDWKPAAQITQPKSTEVTTTNLANSKTLALFLALGSLLVTASSAEAHRLEAQYFVLKDRQIKIEAWYDSGNAAETGKVEVYLPDNRLLTEGSLLPKGLFFFRVEKAETLRIVINPGDGHRKELTIPEGEIRLRLQPKGLDSTGTTLPTVSDDLGKESSLRKEAGAFPLKDVLIGIGFLLAVASFFLSWRNYRTLNRIKQHLGLLGPYPNDEPDGRARMGP
jgi:ABC-type Co2+ transport system permease subunit